MPRKTSALTSVQVRTLPPGRYGDGNGLFLLVRPAGRYWLFRYRVDGRMREMGLGSAGEVTLAAARDLAAPHWAAVKAGTDPLAVKEAEAATSNMVPRPRMN